MTIKVVFFVKFYEKVWFTGKKAAEKQVLTGWFSLRGFDEKRIYQVISAWFKN